MSNWQYVLIGAVFTLPIIVLLVDIRRKVNKVLDGKLAFRRFNFGFDSATDQCTEMAMIITVFNCSLSVMHFKVIDTRITIKDTSRTLAPLQGHKQEIEGLISPYQEMDIRLPHIEGVRTDLTLESEAKIVLAYGQSSTILNNTVEWTIDNIKLEKRDKTYRMLSGALSKVDYKSI